MTNEVARDDSARKSVLICDTQPVAVEGMKWLIENSGDLQFAGSVYSLEAAFELLNPEAAKAARVAKELAAKELAARELAAVEAAELALATLEGQAPDSETLAAETLDTEAVDTPALENQTLELEAAATETQAAGICVVECPAAAIEATESQAIEIAALPDDSPVLEATFEDAPDLTPLPPAIPIHAIVIDKGLGLPDVIELLQKLTATSHATPAVVWGSSISEPEALRLLQAGARGILRRTSESGTLLTCLRAVTSGGTWMEDGIFGSTEKLYNRRRSELTHRESEVVVLVEKGLRNRDIARMLGIQTGTVKIHLKHIFEKTGVRGRYGLALTGLQNKGAITLSPPPQFTA